MLRPSIPNSEKSYLENCKPQQLLGIFGSCMKTGPKGNQYGLLPDAWGILFSNMYLSPVELVDDMRSRKHQLGGENEHLLRQFIKADCASRGTFVLNVIKKGGMIDRSALMMIADLGDLAGLERDGTTAIHLLVTACDRRVRPELIRRLGSRLLSSLYDRNGMPVLLSIFELSDVCIHDLDAITQVFSDDDLRKVLAKNRMGKNALEIFTEISQSIEGKATRDRNTFSVNHAVKNTNTVNVVRQQINSPVQHEGPSAPGVKTVIGKNPEPGKSTITHTPHPSGPVIPDSPKKPGKLQKIMIVDDDQIVRHLLQLRLKILGYDLFIVTENGEEAMKLAQKTKPDIVFMDIAMPGKIDGIAAAREIKKIHPGSRIVFLTGYSDPELIDRAKDIRPDGYILKPFTETDLRVTLELMQ